ncbi:hypothetical protein C8F04DRAFT_1269757 [Mycena alexandri]|uniref:Bacteriophage T5 Orf172 DNA-binding domain-containing protein n=1 Tax=Mycena alexandri TaxID=1745969 RepID=A0AAD6WXP2_9AGAR|nr:hypothetical protein C8F04DRAFT_1269757 [Mycena alexandri]
MATHRTRPKLCAIVNAHKTGNNTVIPASRNEYKTDGAGTNYMLLRQLWSDYHRWQKGAITTLELQARTQVKWGESVDVGRQRTEYHKCEKMYHIVWYASYSTPERKLSESLVHDELTELGARARFRKCSCGRHHREWFHWDIAGGGGVAGVEAAFMQWMGLRGHTNIVINHL